MGRCSLKKHPREKKNYKISGMEKSRVESEGLLIARDIVTSRPFGYAPSRVKVPVPR